MFSIKHSCSTNGPMVAGHHLVTSQGRQSFLWRFAMILFCEPSPPFKIENKSKDRARTPIMTCLVTKVNSLSTSMSCCRFLIFLSCFFTWCPKVCSLPASMSGLGQTQGRSDHTTDTARGHCLICPQHCIVLSRTVSAIVARIVSTWD